MMGTFIDDAIYNYLNTDGVADERRRSLLQQCGRHPDRLVLERFGMGQHRLHDLDGNRARAGAPHLRQHVHVLPFGNAPLSVTMTGAQILEVLNYGPNVAGVIQPAGLKYKYYSYKDANPGPAAVRLGRLRRLRRQQDHQVTASRST